MPVKSTIPDIERFMQYVSPEPNTGCWLWTGSVNSRGYGKFWCNSKLVQSSGFSYRYFVGDFDRSLFVLHSCDVPTCVNPDHLRPGTHRENMDDMLSRGRGKKSAKGLPRGVREFRRVSREVVYVAVLARLNNLYLGQFDTPEEAGEAVREAMAQRGFK